jgi:hypothetical protein
MVVELSDAVGDGRTPISGWLAGGGSSQCKGRIYAERECFKGSERGVHFTLDRHCTT